MLDLLYLLLIVGFFAALLARIRVALRHAALPPGAPPEPVFQAGDVRVDLVRREVRRGDQEVHLTPTEYKLLTLPVRHAGKVLTHRQLLKACGGPTTPINRTTSGCTWRSCGRSLRPIRRGHGCW
jgi:DNA-binding response OmpR family regulator